MLIATPSMATGVSIEVEHFDKVYGLFTGVLSDGDIAQALARESVPPSLGWSGARSTARTSAEVRPQRVPGLKVKQAIQTQWDRETQLIRTSLRPDISPIVEGGV